MLHRSNLGNWIYATGGQRQAADDMGIDTRKVKLFCFMLCSFLAGFAGMITTFRLRSALPSLGEGLELQAIAANVIGGTSLTGGIGSLAGFVIGTFLIRVIDNGLVMARIDANWFRLAIGTLTILAVILNIYAAPPRAGDEGLDGSNDRSSRSTSSPRRPSSGPAPMR